MHQPPSIRITGDCHTHLLRHLNRNDQAEHLAFALAGFNRTTDGLELLVHDLILISDSDLIDGLHDSSLEMTPQRMIDAINIAVLTNSALIEFHNHPMSTGVPRFSIADERGFNETVPYMLSSLKVPIYCGMVVSDSGDFHGSLWLEHPNTRLAIEYFDVVNSSRFARQLLGDSQRPNMGTELTDNALKRFDRQVRAFGKDGQQRISSIRVSIVGLGGLGSVIAQLLSRVGFSYFVLIDPDVAELSNLSRIPGATREDVRSSISKVDIAARNIRAANPEATVVTIPTSVYSPNAMRQLTGTDLIITATDDVGTRFAVNELALAYLRPLLDVATEIHTSNRKLTGVGGRYTFTFPGEGCLLCARAIDAVEAAADFVPREVKQSQQRAGYIAESHETAPSVMPLNSVLASLATMEILVWGTCVRPVVKQMIYDGLTGMSTRVSYDRLLTCRQCRELLGRGDSAELITKYRHWLT